MTAPPLPQVNLQGSVLQAISNGAQAVLPALHMSSITPVDEGQLGDFPWYFANGVNTNNATYNWVNTLFGYDAANGYVSSVGTVTTELYNLLGDIDYVVSPADAAALNTANLQVANVIATLMSDWTSTQGPIPASYATQSAQLGYIIQQVLAWGSPVPTLAQLRTSLNPSSLLPNTPVGGDQIVSNLMSYLSATNSVSRIQNAQSDAKNELDDMRRNLTAKPAAAGGGWIETVDRSGNTLIVPQWGIAEGVGNIANGLAGNLAFSVTLNAYKENSNEVKVSASGGVAGFGTFLDLIGISGQASASYDMFSFDQSVTEVDIELAFTGVTAVTPVPLGYSSATRQGWWDTTPIHQANNPVAGQSGYAFTSAPQHTLGVDGNFGVLSRIAIAPQPTFTLTYSTSDYSAFTQKIAQNSKWGISFLGIPLAGGSQSYFNATTKQDAAAGTVTVTMTPTPPVNPVNPQDQTAFVVGAELVWPGA